MTLKEKGKTSKGITDKTFIGMFWSFSGTLIQGLSQFIVLIVLTRAITPEAFGIVSAALVVIGFSSIFSSLGVGSAIVQRPKLTQTHINMGFTLSIILGLFLSLILWVLSPLIASFFGIDELTLVMRLFSIVFTIQGISLVSQSLLQREMNFKIIAKIQVLSYVLGYGLVSIVLAYLGVGYWALVVGHLSQNIINTVMLMVAVRHSKKIIFNKKAFNELMFFGGGHTIARVFNYFAIQGDNLMIGRLLGARDLGLYGRAYQLMVMPATLFGQVVDKVLFAAMSQIQSSKDSLTRSFKTGILVIGLITIPLSVYIIVLAPNIIVVLFGEKWMEVVVPFQILTIGMFLRTSYKISDSIARATGAVYKRAWRQIIYALLVIIGSYIGHFWGLNGVVVAVVIALLCNFILMAGLSLKILSMGWLDFIRLHISPIVLAIIVYIQLLFTYPYAQRIIEWNLLIVLLTFILSLITVAVPIVLLPKWFLKKEGMWLIQKLTVFIRGKLNLRDK